MKEQIILHKRTPAREKKAPHERGLKNETICSGGRGHLMILVFLFLDFICHQTQRL